jgi:hypothetical protein
VNDTAGHLARLTDADRAGRSPGRAERDLTERDADRWPRPSDQVLALLTSSPGAFGNSQASADLLRRIDWATDDEKLAALRSVSTLAGNADRVPLVWL